MINFEMNVKATENLEKMKNLAVALGECDIKSELIIDEDENIISLSFGLWNCVNGNTEVCCVYCAEFEDWELSSYTEPTSDRERWMTEVEAL